MASIPRVLITGATGFVGSWMIKTVPPNVEYIGLDRNAYQYLEHFNAVTHVVHLAPVAPDFVIRFANENNARLLYCSSGIVHYPEVDSQYRRDKMQWENDCLLKMVNVVIARLFTFFGDGLDDGKAITAFFKAAREGRPLQVHGNVVRSYMHGAEMGRQMWRILFDGVNGRAYDVGSRHPVTLKRVAERISRFTGAPIEYVDKYVPVPVYYPRGDNGILD